MSELLFILSSLVLVTSNPLQGLTSCPVIRYQQKPEVPAAQVTNIVPYYQLLSAQNHLAPSTSPYLYNDQIRGLYLDKAQTNPSINSIVDPNLRAVDQNIFDITRYITNPAAGQPNVVNNYIIVPSEYLRQNQSIANVLQTANFNRRNPKSDNHKNNTKSKREGTVKTEDAYTNNNQKKKVKDTPDSEECKSVKSQNKSEVKKKKKKSSKYNDGNNAEESPKTVENKNKTKKSMETLNIGNDGKNQEYKTNKIDSSSGTKNAKRKKRKRKTKTKENKLPTNDRNNEKNNLNEKARDISQKTADFDLCFDIDEDCECHNRRARHNCCEHKHKQQPYYPREFMNIASYLNSFMSNPQYGTNYYSPYGNFPYNFDYLYQTPQQHIQKSNESSKKHKGKKKKQKSNKTDITSATTVKTDSIKSPDLDDIKLNNCEVVELKPEFIEIDELPDPPLENVVAVINDSVEPDDVENVQNIAEDLPNDSDGTKLNADELSKETLYIATVPGQEYNQIFNYFDMVDDYYPDFTSDTVYLSKEDYDSNNFRDRHFYTSDSEAEMSRDSRRYERLNAKTVKNNVITNNEDEVKGVKSGKTSQRRNNIKKENLKVTFRTPPPLEYPDFKTERVNMDWTHNYLGDEDKKEVFSEKPTHNDVETIYGHSRVVRYGPTENIEVKSTASDVPDNRRDKNLISNDGGTTFVIARSLVYADD